VCPVLCGREEDDPEVWLQEADDAEENKDHASNLEKLFRGHEINGEEK
jgi:hypothetical protein